MKCSELVGESGMNHSEASELESAKDRQNQSVAKASESAGAVYVAQEQDAGLKVIDVLVRRLHLSSRQLKKAKRSRLVRVNGQKISLNAYVAKGDRIALAMEDEENIFAPEPIRFGVVYEDEHLIVADKPPFLVVHPTKGHQTNTLGNAVAFHMMQRGDAYKIRFINRLDRDTSGLVLIAKNALCQQRITDQMMAGTVKKRYLAIVEGLTDETGRIDLPIGRESEEEIRRKVLPTGKAAITEFHRRSVHGTHSLVEIDLLTGRTHQIRVHFSAIGHPVLGDPLYGNPSPYISRQALHCFEMALDHPMSGERMTFRAELPQDMQDSMLFLDSHQFI